jgi:hypothetical protein
MIATPVGRTLPPRSGQDFQKPRTERKENIYTSPLSPYTRFAGGHRLEALRPDSTWRLNFPFGVWMTCAG